MDDEPSKRPSKDEKRCGQEKARCSDEKQEIHGASGRSSASPHSDVDTANLPNVMDVPVLSPRPPPSPPWNIQVESANADTTQNPANWWAMVASCRWSGVFAREIRKSTGSYGTVPVQRR